MGSLGQTVSIEHEFRRELVDLIQKWELKDDSEKYVKLLKKALSATLNLQYFDVGIVNQPTPSQDAESIQIDDLVTHSEAAEILKIAPTTLYALTWQKKGPPFHQRGKRNFYSKKALQLWEQNQYHIKVKKINGYN